MFKPAPVFIGLRYTRAKRRNHFISFITLTSMLGIALGVMALITVLSVMNGFDREIKKRVFSMVAPVTVSSVTGYLTEWRNLQKTLSGIPGVVNTAPFVNGEALLTFGSQVAPALVNGILPEQEMHITALAEKVVEGKLSALKSGTFSIILGEELAKRLNVSVGDLVTAVTPQMSLTPAGVIPRFKRFKVVGIFNAGSGFGFDAALAYTNLSDAQKLYGVGNLISGIHISLQNVFSAPQMSKELTAKLSSSAYITNWTDQFGAFFHAVRLEKTMMFFILLLIVAVAAFNLVATLVMVVNDKESDIAIMRTYGATPRMIMSIFIVQGGVIGLVGTLLGILGGVWLTFHVTEIVNWIEKIFHVQFLSSSVYFVDYLPSELQWVDVLEIGSTALILSFLATIYPAWQASRMDPVEALRYE